MDYISYKGEEIPCTVKTILEHQKTVIGNGIILPYLHFKAKKYSIPVNCKIRLDSLENVDSSTDKVILIEKYIDIAKIFIDYLEKNNALGS